jgi:hypothetical protein
MRITICVVVDSTTPVMKVAMPFVEGESYAVDYKVLSYTVRQ